MAWTTDHWERGSVPDPADAFRPVPEDKNIIPNRSGDVGSSSNRWDKGWFTKLNVDEDVVINEGAGAYGLRVESEDYTHVLYTSGGFNVVGVAIDVNQALTAAYMARLIVFQDDETDGMPVLTLKQADEEGSFIKFMGGQIYTSRVETIEGEFIKIIVGESTDPSYLKIYHDPL